MSCSDGSYFPDSARNNCLGVVFDPPSSDMCRLIPASADGRSATSVSKMWRPIHHLLYGTIPLVGRGFSYYRFLGHPANGIKMDPSLHRLFDRGVFALLPIVTDGMQQLQVANNNGNEEFVVLENTTRANVNYRPDELWLTLGIWTIAVNVTRNDNQVVARIDFTRPIGDTENNRTFALIVSSGGVFADRVLFQGKSLRNISAELEEFWD